MFVFNWLLIRAQILKNVFKQNKKAFFLRDVWHSVIILAGLSLIYFFLNAMFRFIGSKGLPPFEFAFVLMSFSLLVFLPLVFYSAIVCSLSFLFQKEELHFYFSMSVNTLSVFTVKFLQTYFHTIWMAFLGFITFLAAVQTYFKITLWIYFTGSVAFLAFLLIPVCLAVILVIIISRFVPFVRERGILTVVGLFVGSILVAAIRVMQPEQLVSAEGKMRLVTFVQNLRKPWMTFLPSEWVTNVLFAQAQNDFTGILLNLLSILISAIICVIVLYVIAGFFYKKSWSKAVVASGADKKKFGWQVLLGMFPSSLRVFIQKDLISFYRDTIEKGSLLILIPLSFVYLYSIHLLRLQIQKATSEQLFSFLFIYIFNFFYSSVVIAGLSGRWVFPSISLEGNNFKLIKGSPTALRDFLKAKFALGFVPLFVLGQILILASSFILRLTPYFILVSALTMTLLCWGITMICLILGIREADFSISAPLDFALSVKGFLCMVWEFIFVGLVIALVGFPTWLFIYGGFSRQFVYSLLASLFIISAAVTALLCACKTSLASLSIREV